MKKAIQNNLYMLKFIWKYCKSNVILRLLSTLTAPVQPFIFIITMKMAIDGIAENRDLKYLLTIILTAFLVGAVSAFLIHGLITIVVLKRSKNCRRASKMNC